MGEKETIEKASGPKVTVITPTFNSAGYVADNIKSVLEQTYPKIEHVFVDNGSTDDTLSIIKELDPGAVVISEPDQGISDAFNKGVALATGDVVATLNSDDYYNGADAVEKVVEVFMDNPGVRVVYGKIRVIDPETLEAELVVGKPYRWGRGGGVDNKDMLASIAHPAYFVGKEVYETVGGYSLEYRCAMDYDFFMRSSALYEPYFLDELITIMRGGGLSARNIFQGHRETFRILRSGGMGLFSAVVDLCSRYALTFASLLLRKVGLAGIVFLYRRRSGRY